MKGMLSTRWEQRWRRRMLLIKVIYCDGRRTDIVGGYLRYATFAGKKMKNKF